ncbi:MAG TPA: glycogen synthase [Acidobacteriaceae bacterium]|nr:glycogen synthase [Acidobacteriaceae bacterium]
MRVGLMTREYPPYVYGGAGVHVEYLSRELARSIEVEVHAWGTPPESAKAPETPLLPEPIGRNLQVFFEQPWDAISTGTSAKFRGALEALSLNLLEQLHLEKLDIIHTHTWYVSMAGFLAKKLYGIPFVLTTHSLEPLRAWKAEQLGTGYALSSWMERTAILDADAIVAVSNGTKADILRAYPDVDPARIHVIYNGIDLDQYQYTPRQDALLKYGVDPHKPYVLFVGRITRQKGVTHLVDAIRYLPPGTQVVLCAGAPDTPEIATEMRDKVQALTHVDVADVHNENHEPGVRPALVTVESDNVHNPPGHAVATGDYSGRGHNIVWIEQMVSKEEAIQLYSHCAVFCCPSVYEPFGIINLEAMACRAPVVASATGGILEVVVDEEKSRTDGTEPTGHLIPFAADTETSFPTDPDAFARDLAHHITALLNDPEKARVMGEAGRRRVEAHFSWTAIAAQTIDLYRTLIAAKP